MENTNEKTKLQEAGAFWIKKSKAGNSFLTGTVKSQSGEINKVIVFKNQYKTEGSNQPDYRVYFDTSVAPNSETTNAAPAVTSMPAAPVKNTTATTATAVKPAVAPETEDIPF